MEDTLSRVKSSAKMTVFPVLTLSSLPSSTLLSSSRLPFSSSSSSRYSSPSSSLSSWTLSSSYFIIALALLFLTVPCLASGPPPPSSSSLSSSSLTWNELQEVFSHALASDSNATSTLTLSKLAQSLKVDRGESHSDSGASPAKKNITSCFQASTPDHAVRCITSVGQVSHPVFMSL